jgi:hypothetical protein
MCSKNIVSWFSVVAIFVSWNNTVAADMKVQVSGFLTAIATQTVNEKDATYNNGVATKDLEMNTRDNHVGIQFASSIDPTLDVTAQFISRGGAYENYDLETDWAYVDYKPFENTKLRVGKYKVPQFIASDYQDVGYAYPWVRPPQDVYGTNPLISLNGVNLSYKFKFGSSKLFFDAFYGDGRHKSFVPARTADAIGEENSLPSEVVEDLKGKPLEFDTKQTTGFAVKFSAQSYTLRAGYFETKVDVNADLGNGLPPMTMSKVPGAFGGVGFTMDIHNIIAYSEFIRRNTDPEMANAFPDQDAWYATLGVRVGKLLPTVTYSQIKPGVDKSDLAIEQTSTAIDLRYDIGKTADIKFEAMYVKPKEGNHGLFYEPVKDGKVYTASFDVIF